ncbi:mitochondrial ribosomal protein S30 [Arctopsyche grandis]|uniref:mitochondrial ribosomal protein S30 n=1 Tax=Arctopsyche grandis TaxID=121162 RepID=UPI00406D8D65
MSFALVRGRAEVGKRLVRGARSSGGAAPLTQLDVAPPFVPPPPPTSTPSTPASVQSQAKYPPIEDLSPEAKFRRLRIARDEAVKAVPTIEEKIIKINMPKYYGWRSFLFKDGLLPVHALTPIQYFTKTQLIVNDTLPSFYLPLAPAAEYHAQRLRPQIEEMLVAEYQGISRDIVYDENVSKEKQYDALISKCVLRQMNRIFINYLSSNIPHLMESQVDVDPRLEAFWFVGGLDPPKRLITQKKKTPFYKDIEDAPVDRPFQFLGTPILTLRNDVPLEPLLSDSDLANIEYSIPTHYTYAPEIQGFTDEHRHGTYIPGFWPGDIDEFGTIAFYSREYLADPLKSYSAEENQDKLHANGIVSSFGWLMAQAAYLGFSTFNDITYPLTTQTVISNGQHWSFYAYQMNTVLFYGDHIFDKSSRNICFGTNSMKLYDSIDNDGKVINFNEDVLKTLLQFYLNAPKPRVDTVMKPYLGEKAKMVAEIRGPEKREWLENRFKLLVSNRPRHKLIPEIYDWEYLYKINHEVRFMDAKRRPFELKQNAFARKLNDHIPKYIPKVLRTGRNYKRAWQRSFYPE